MLSADQLDEFATEGYLVVRGLVPADAVAAANAAVDRLIERDPLPAGHIGNHAYMGLADPVLLGLQTTTPILAAAEALTGADTLDPAEALQVALSIPPWLHAPAGTTSTALSA
ncbi:hypothetical protein AB0K00_50410 [Dactylosporangium sp. NPDC049525]|uniref:hypothetical protein n=1 Tax=Dactylosporangium sp. NPDC049525 TaxID=3154730 RepID=UPI003427A374